MAWTAGATFVNPAAGTILCDTGPLQQGYWRFQIVATANTGLEVLRLRAPSGIRTSV